MAFNLGDALKNVSNLGTGREQITYLPLSSLDADSGNFYMVRDVEALADNISVAGLQQPIRVRKGENLGRYTIVSGHRRLAACRKLAEEQPEVWQEVPCIIETDAASPALQQLRLIYANANTRQLTSAEMSEQAQQVEKLLYDLKEEGYEFPGRMRDHVAEAVGASKSKLARLKVIRDNLIPDWAGLWKEDKIAESQAYELARIPAEHQQYLFSWTPEKQRGMLGQYGVTCRAAALDALPNPSCDLSPTGCCDNLEGMRMQIVRGNTWEAKCTGCCKDCYNRSSCKNVCPRIAPSIKAEQKKLREAEKARKKKEQDAAETRELQRRDLWKRFEAAREAAGIDYLDLIKAADLCIMDTTRQEYLANPDGDARLNYHPYGYGGTESLMRLVSVADALGVSTDYLLGREAPVSEAPAPEAGIWHSGEPEEPGRYIAWCETYNRIHFVVCLLQWDGNAWKAFGYEIPDDWIVHLWTAQPELSVADAEPECALGAPCKTGLSSSGKCGAAAYCDEPAECCLECDKDCSCRCGWIEDGGNGNK